MNRRCLLVWAAVLAAATTLPPGNAFAGKHRPEIHVSTVDELYDAVQPANADTIVLLAPGTYTLEPTRPNGGRLTLPPGMDLIGVKRQHGLESRIVVPPLSGTVGAIRLGDRNVVRWITVEATVFAYPASPPGDPVAVAACIDVNVLPPAPAGMVAEVTDCIVIGATRGIRIQHPPGGAATGRTSRVVLERNEVRDPGDSFGFGIQFQNQGLSSTIDASLRKNSCSGGRMGLFVVCFAVNDAEIRLRSQGNVYADNVAGVVLDGGRNAATNVGSNDSRIELTSIGDAILNNVGETPDGGSAGGLTAIGGFSSSATSNPSSGNHVSLTLRGTTFAGNLGYGLPLDLTAIGGLGLGTLPGGGNRVDVRLDDVTTEVPGTFVFACSLPGQPPDEPPNVVEVVIDDEPVPADCD